MSTLSVAVSGSSIITNPMFGGVNNGALYEMHLTPEKISQASFVFPKDAIVVFDFSKYTAGGEKNRDWTAHPDELSGNSRLLKITVYKDAEAYLNGEPTYYYRPQNADGTNLSNSADRIGDNYLSVQTNGFAAQHLPPVVVDPSYTGTPPRLGQEILIMPGVNFQTQLIENRERLTIKSVSDFNPDDTSIPPGTTYHPNIGNGFFNAGVFNDYTERTYINPPVQPPLCFTKGTLIETDLGAIPVEALREGMLLRTLDRGFQPLRWLGRRVMTRGQLAARPDLRPIRIAAGALGAGMPARDLLVSPQHRLFIRSKIAERMFGVREILLPAIALERAGLAEVVDEPQEVVYFHVLLDHHEVLFAEGALAESLFGGREALNVMGPELLAELRLLFPQLAVLGEAPEPVRLLARGRRAAKLLERHQSNQQAVVAG